MQRIFLRFYLIIIYSLFCVTGIVAQNNVIANLKTEYTEEPLGIDVTEPRFSWQMTSSKKGSKQTAYQIVVHDEYGEQVWDSEKIYSDISLNIKYNGSKLKPCHRYNWNLYVWDQDKKQYHSHSWFETGLLNSNIEAWEGAKWIGGKDDKLPFSPHYLTVFKINYTLQLDENRSSVKAGFVYGANDGRLMNKNMNLFNIENEIDQSYYIIELDISKLNSETGSAFLNIFRKGYHPDDSDDTPLHSIAVSNSIINKTNRYDAHRFHIHSVLGNTHIYINGTENSHLVGEVNLNPIGRGGDFIAYPVVGDIGFSIKKNQTAYFSEIEIRNFRDPSSILFQETDINQSIFRTFKENLSVVDNQYKLFASDRDVIITSNPERNSMPMLRTLFSVDNKEISKARLYVTSRGIYEMYLNGERIGDDFFNPGLTQYNKTHLYQTYDVTKHIVKGKNALGGILGEGWWSGAATYMGDFWNFFGDRQSLLSKLVITYSDNSKEVITSDPQEWKYFDNGPVVYSSLFQGEIYDATKEEGIKDWSKAEYNDSEWEQAIEIELDNTISADPANEWHNMPMTNDYSEFNLIGQYGETVKAVKEITSIDVEEIRPGVFVYDMGQNMVGIPHIKLHNLAHGQKIFLRFAEVKYPHLPEYENHSGMIMLENIRAAMAQDIYIAKGETEETINPRFTFHGYRYIEISGIEKALPLESVKGQVLSSVHEISSSFTCSNPNVNKLWENITWSTLSNFLSIPTDCPQRNERMGWGGDISVFSRTATYLMDAAQFLRRHVQAMRDTQRDDGRFSDVAPLGGGFGGILWGSAGITVPWESYLQFDDVDLLKEHYSSMKLYVEYLISQIDEESNVMGYKYRGNWGSLTDWLGPEDHKNEKTLLWEAYFIYDLDIMQKVAAILNQKEDILYYKRLYDERKAFFNDTYIDNETGKTVFRDTKVSKTNIVDTQTSYILPLAFDIIEKDNKELVIGNLINSIERESIADDGVIFPPYSLMTGFIGTAWIAQVLTENGYNSHAYKLLQQNQYPSWLYSVEQGATTIWERLNSYTHTNGFGGNNHMNSFNHYSFGAIGAWMYNTSLGIERDEKSPGFKHFILNPHPDVHGEMTFAKGHYNSMYGEIKSSWKIVDNKINYSFTIPANTSATLLLEAKNINNIKIGKRKLKSVRGVRFNGMNQNKYSFELQSGTYSITVKTN